MPFCSSIDNSCFFYTQFTPPPLAPDDSKRGVINLIERKIIPVRTFWNFSNAISLKLFHVLNLPIFNHCSTGGFLMFSGGIKVEHWLKMG